MSELRWLVNDSIANWDIVNKIWSAAFGAFMDQFSFTAWTQPRSLDKRLQVGNGVLIIKLFVIIASFQMLSSYASLIGTIAIAKEDGQRKTSVEQAWAWTLRSAIQLALNNRKLSLSPGSTVIRGLIWKSRASLGQLFEGSGSSAFDFRSYSSARASNICGSSISSLL